jgi:hypothetical protein
MLELAMAACLAFDAPAIRLDQPNKARETS